MEKIGENAFTGCSSLFVGQLRLPASIKEIGAKAFKDCSSLAWIDLSACINLKQIYNETFRNSNIESVRFPEGESKLYYIGEMAFADCKRLGHGKNASVSLCSSITSISDGAFMNCTSLHTINLKNAIPYYSNSTDREIWNAVFNGCTALTTVTLSDKITVIPPRMFENCTSLNKITLPDNVTTICENAFLNCSSLTGSLKKPFKLPAKLEVIGTQAFMDCSSLKWINYVKTNKTIQIKEKAFANDKDLEYFVVRKIDTTPVSRSSSEGGLIIESNAFLNCPNLKSVPEGASSISSFAFGWDYKFTSITVPCYCPEVTSVVLSDLCGKWTKYSDVNTIYFAGEVETIESNSLSDYTELTNVCFLAPMSEDGIFGDLSIQENSFAANKKIEVVECFNPTPPLLHEKGFADETYNNAKLIVPEESVELYKNANGWKRFFYINVSSK